MIGNLGPTLVKGYDSKGNSKWFQHGLQDGYTGNPPEIKEPEMPAPVPADELPNLKVTPPKRAATIPDPKR